MFESLLEVCFGFKCLIYDLIHASELMYFNMTVHKPETWVTGNKVNYDKPTGRYNDSVLADGLVSI